MMGTRRRDAQDRSMSSLNARERMMGTRRRDVLKTRRRLLETRVRE